MSLSLQSQPLTPVRDETARVARAAFPHGNMDMHLRDQIGIIYPTSSTTMLHVHVCFPGGDSSHGSFMRRCKRSGSEKRQLNMQVPTKSERVWKAPSHRGCGLWGCRLWACGGHATWDWPELTFNISSPRLPSTLCVSHWLQGKSLTGFAQELSCRAKRSGVEESFVQL